jgi:hypothetical protein
MARFSQTLLQTIGALSLKNDLIDATTKYGIIIIMINIKDNFLHYFVVGYGV